MASYKCVGKCRVTISDEGGTPELAVAELFLSFGPRAKQREGLLEPRRRALERGLP